MPDFNMNFNGDHYEITLVEQDADESVYEVYTNNGDRLPQGDLYVSHRDVEEFGAYKAVADTLYRRYVVQKVENPNGQAA